MATKTDKKLALNKNIKEIEYLNTLLKYTLLGIEPGTMNEKVNSLFRDQAQRLRFEISLLKQL